MSDKIKTVGFLAVFSFFVLTTTAVIAEEAPKTPPAPAAQNQPAASLISANGFACSMVEGQNQCQGKFEEVDKKLLFGAKGGGDITLRVTKGEDSYIYFSRNGCLCEANKKEMECKNAAGKKETFKGDKMREQSSAFCALKK